MKESSNFQDHRKFSCLNFTSLQSIKVRERKFLKPFLISFFHQLFHEKFQSYFLNQSICSMEFYAMDDKIIQSLIKEIIETEEYTLEGIATYTRIPLDIIIDALVGNGYQFSMTFWARIISLYIQVKPEISEFLCKKILEMKDSHHHGLSIVLDEN